VLKIVDEVLKKYPSIDLQNITLSNHKKSYWAEVGDAQNLRNGILHRNFQKLVIGIGKGIGNTAAHETGHQLSFQVYKFPLTNIDCGTDTQPCEGNIDSVYEFYKSDDWDYVGWQPPIHWQSSNQCNLVKYLLNSNSCQ
jgi:hypothetical protein